MVAEVAMLTLCEREWFEIVLKLLVQIWFLFNAYHTDVGSSFDRIFYGLRYEQR